MKTRQINAIALAVVIFGMAMAWGPRATAADTMPGMDHGNMNHAAQAPVDDIQDMNQPDSGTENTPSMQGGAAPANARDPHAYSGGQDFGPIPPPRMADEAYMGSLLFNRLESAASRDNTLTRYDLMGRFGKDYDKLVLKAEGDMQSGKLTDARTELLWGHALAAYWDTQLGVRHDSGLEPHQSWLAFGIQGLAPYWFEVEATAYIGEQGHTALRLSTEYELLLTQKLILQPRAEFNLHGKNDPTRDMGSGLSDALAGLRLRYEFTRQFAPYVGIEWAGKFGETADLARAAGTRTSETRWVAGVRFWF